MTVLTLSILLLLTSLFAGLIGSLTGLGGGVVLIPILTLVFKVDIHYAIGTSLISVIATSSGAASAYVKEGFSNIRLGMFLELATTVGAIAGAALAIITATWFIAILFGLVLIFSAITSFMKKDEDAVKESRSRLAAWLRLNSNYPEGNGSVSYYVVNVIGGFLMMIVAGILSGLLGIGSGALKVIAMDKVMRIPFKVSTTTSNFMIGVTAAASAGLYLKRGYIDPGLSMPVVIGVLTGSFLGTRILVKARSGSLRIFFAAIILIMAFEMIYNGFTHHI